MKKTALVTGGSRGIGFGIAVSLAKEHFDLCIVGVRPEADVSAPLGELRSHGHDVFYVQADVSVAADRERLVEETKGHFGQLNLLVNNAGVAPRVRRDILETTEDSFDEVWKINARGPFFLTQQVARWMIEQKEQSGDFIGMIINISSISAIVASPSRGEYCISKAGISMATQLWAVRLGEFGIPVYEVRPGVMKTDMTSAVQAKYDKLISEGLLLQPRWGTPEDVGKAVASLARGDLAYSTGQILMVDGGLTRLRL